MSGNRAALIRAKGLYTFSNELAVPEGALVVAKNINIDEPGVITPRRGLNDYGDALPQGDDRVKQLMRYKGRLIRHYDDVLQYENDSNTFTSFSGNYKELEDGLRLKFQEVKGNLYFTESEGVKKLSSNSSDLTSVSITNAGGVKAYDMTTLLSPTIGGFLPPQSKVAYRLVFGIKDVNNNLILGSPSPRVILSNTSADINVPEKSEITVSDSTSIVNSDYVTFETPSNQYFIWFNTDGTGTEPQNASVLGRVGYEVDVQGLPPNNNSVAAAIATVISKNISDITTELSTNVVTLTNTESGNIDDAATNNGTAFTVTSLIDGSITQGLSANSDLTFSLPSDITNEHFYQIYRTAVTTVQEGLTINDIDPGEEFNLVLESGITTTDISNGSITVEDITPESFRTSGTPLYTNPITGQGILQANEKPPICKDMALFRNSMFYANTKLSHRTTIDLLSVDDITSGTTEFIIGNKDGLSRYTFVGTAEVTDFTADDPVATTENGYIEINSANNERKYYIWFDKGTGTDPAISGKLGIRVDLSDVSASTDVQDTVDRISTSISDIDDFLFTDLGSGQFRITNTNNGDSTDASLTSLINNWNIDSITSGTGEDSANNEVLLSALASVGQAIDETARSLVRIINQDSNSPVNATYLSGEDDLPGQILLENRSLADNPFYLATNDSNFQTEMNPELPLLETISSVTPSGTQTVIGAAGHTLVAGDFVYISSPSSFPTIGAKYEVVSTTVNDFTINFELQTGDSTNSFYWLADIESDNVESPNRLYYSKVSQPESVPLLNFVDIGPQDQPIERIISLRDNLMVFKTDGIYILSGTSALSGFSVRVLDNSSSLIAPDSPAVINNQIYCLTTEGISTVTETGVSIISRPIEDRIFSVVNSRFDYKYKTFGLAYDSDKAYILWMPTLTSDETATQCFRYNTFERSWTRWDVPATCGIIKQSDDKLYLGAGDREYVLQERKNGDRTDYADRSFSLSIPNDAVSSNLVRLSNVSSLSEGDAILQEQYITVSQFNQLLRKLDIDTGLDDTDYTTTLSMSEGDNLEVKLDALNAKLVADDSSGIVTTHSFPNNDWETLQNSYNDLIDELNNASCDTNYKDYINRTSIVPYEALILNVDTVKNTITLSFPIPLLEGSITAFKRIDSLIQWSPQHFGDPSGLKQMREGTIIFDQNNFYSATVSYSTDLSAGFEDVPYKGKGTAYWGYANYGGADLYWGGNGNDIPFRDIIPRGKQRARYLNVRFHHSDARNQWRILGISAVVRPLSSRAYR